MTAPPSTQAKNRLAGFPDWLNDCIYPPRSSTPYANMANVSIGLSADALFAGKIVFDEMYRQPAFIEAVPGIAEEGPWPRPVEDGELLALQKWLHQHGLPHLALTVVHDGLRYVAYQKRVHSLRDWLRGLQWDGVSRIERWLATCLGAEDNPYHAAVGTWFLVSMVARVFAPGCKADYMLVFEGPQGKLKSTAAATLAGPQYFSDDLPDLAGDPIRASMHLRGKWLVEVAELAAFNRVESARLKSFLTRQRECYIPKYGRLEVNEPRQTVFIGTTNQATYLRDEAGGRRFWPVKCGAIDIARLAQEREQMFAEAVHAYRQDVKWWPDAAFEEKHIKPHQDNRYERDAWEDKIALHYAQYPTTSTTLLQIAVDVLDFSIPRLGTADQRRIVYALERLGWQRGPRNNKSATWLPPISL